MDLELAETGTERTEGRRPWTRHQLMEFHQIVQLYLEFLQREKTAKLKKLRQAQRQLPIAQFRDDIVATVRANQITIIAGNSGQSFLLFLRYLCFPCEFMSPV